MLASMMRPIRGLAIVSRTDLILFQPGCSSSLGPAPVIIMDFNRSIPDSWAHALRHREAMQTRPVNVLWIKPSASVSPSVTPRWPAAAVLGHSRHFLPRSFNSSRCLRAFVKNGLHNRNRFDIFLQSNSSAI
jgi:hypothetical protein